MHDLVILWILFFHRSVIEFLYGFLVPSFSLPPPKVTPVHEILTEILKKMNYPGTVSKSHFQTLGGPSWGAIVGVLHFFLQLAKSVVALSKPENFTKMNFPNVDNGKWKRHFRNSYSLGSRESRKTITVMIYLI